MRRPETREPARRLRRRNTITEALETFRSTPAPGTISAFIAFLYVCENEGIGLRALCQLCKVQLATGSRTVRGLAKRDAMGALPPYAGLIEIFQDPDDERARMIFLTEEGGGLRDRLQVVITKATPIAPAGAS